VKSCTRLLFCSLAALGVNTGLADISPERQFIWEEGNSQMASARTTADFAKAAETYRRLGRRGEESRQLEALAELEPTRPERVVALALALDRQGHRDAALQVLGRATRRFDQSALPYVALGRMWLDADRDDPDPLLVDKALEALTQATALDRRSESLALLGRAWARKGDSARALEAFEQATTILPVDPEAFTLLGDAADRAGRTARRATRSYARRSSPAMPTPARRPAEPGGSGCSRPSSPTWPPPTTGSRARRRRSRTTGS
jgi:tetratricopeptide (TPR) repeat protein